MEKLALFVIVLLGLTLIMSLSSSVGVIGPWGFWIGFLAAVFLVLAAALLRKFYTK